MKNSVKLFLSGCMIIACTQVFAQTDTTGRSHKSNSDKTLQDNPNRNPNNTRSKNDTTGTHKTSPNKSTTPKTNRSTTSPPDTTHRSKNPGTASAVIIN